MQILHPVERSLEKHIQAFECLELSCKVSIPNAPVRWFKDGLEVDETNNLLLQMEGAERRLVVLQAGAEDAGEYICETKDESVSFDVRVSGEHSDLEPAVLRRSRRKSIQSPNPVPTLNQRRNLNSKHTSPNTAQTELQQANL